MTSVRTPDGQVAVEVDTLQTRRLLRADWGLMLVQRLATVCPLRIPLLRDFIITLDTWIRVLSYRVTAERTVSQHLAPVTVTV